MNLTLNEKLVLKAMYENNFGGCNFDEDQMGYEGFFDKRFHAKAIQLGVNTDQLDALVNSLAKKKCVYEMKFKEPDAKGKHIDRHAYVVSADALTKAGIKQEDFVEEVKEQVMAKKKIELVEPEIIDDEMELEDDEQSDVVKIVDVEAVQEKPVKKAVKKTKAKAKTATPEKKNKTSSITKPVAVRIPLETLAEIEKQGMDIGTVLKAYCEELVNSKKVVACPTCGQNLKKSK